MKLKLLNLVFLVLLFFINSLFAGSLNLTSANQNIPPKICGTPLAQKADPQAYLDYLKRTDPAAYQQILQEIQEVESFNKTSTTQKTFWALNLEKEPYTHYQVAATLERTGNLTRIWVENESLTKGYVNDAVLDQLLDNLEHFSGATSIDPSRGIVEIDTMLFGQPPNYDGDGIIDFLVLNIKDTYDSTSNQAFVAGYFYSNDQTENSFSNKMDLMYLDSYPGIYSNGNYRTEPVLSTTAHEFQHLIHYAYDKNEVEWVNEGLSELAGTYCGYGLDSPSLYLQNTNHSLLEWGGEVKDYSRANLWTLYCAEQLGLTFIKNLTQDPLHSIAGFNAALAQSGSAYSLTTFFPNWVLANRINNVSFDPRYGYNLVAARGLRAEGSTLVHSYQAPDNNISGSVENMAMDFHRFRGKDSLDIFFQSGVPPAYWIIGKDNFYRISTPFSEISVPAFSPDSTYTLAVYSTGGELYYKYQAYAKYSLKYFDISYGGEEPDLSLQFSNLMPPVIPANIFTVPEADLSLDEIRFWNLNSTTNIKIHFYDNANGSPGDDIIPPLQTATESNAGWLTYILPEPLTGLTNNQKIFVGVEYASKENGIGYSSVNQPSVSYLYQNNGGGWRALSDFKVGENNLNGVFMIGASFSRLIATEELTGTTTDLFALEGNYPNPVFSGRTTFFQFHIPDAGRLRIVIYNTLGQKVADILRSGIQKQQTAISWNSEGFNGPLSSGIYFYNLIYYNPFTGEQMKSGFKKLVYLK